METKRIAEPKNASAAVVQTINQYAWFTWSDTGLHVLACEFGCTSSRFDSTIMKEGTTRPKRTDVQTVERKEQVNNQEIKHLWLAFHSAILTSYPKLPNQNRVDYERRMLHLDPQHSLKICRIPTQRGCVHMCIFPCKDKGFLFLYICTFPSSSGPELQDVSLLES
jgi:hypothetical protein